MLPSAQLAIDTYERLARTEIIDDLTYCNYRHNRRLRPDISPERWVKVYGPNAVAMEERFQEEQSCR